MTFHFFSVFTLTILEHAFCPNRFHDLNQMMWEIRKEIVSHHCVIDVHVAVFK